MDFRDISLYKTVMIDTRFTTALQIVVNVAVDGQRGVRSTSLTLAERLNTNASFIRKLLSPMTTNGLLNSAAGNGGGIKLARQAADIRLSEIYRSINADSPLWNARDDVPGICFVSNNIERLSNSLSKQAEQAVLETLENVTVADAIVELQRLDEEREASIEPPRPKIA